MIESITRVLSYPKRGIGEVTISSLIIIACFNGNFSDNLKIQIKNAVLISI